MALLSDQMALYGLIDQQVVDAKNRGTPEDRELVAMVERFLPRSTGFGQSGWYEEIKELIQRLPTDLDRTLVPLTFPDPLEAITRLGDLPEPRDSVAPRDHSVADEPQAPGLGFEDLEPYSPANDPVLARTTYAAIVLDKVFKAQGDATHSAELARVVMAGLSSFHFELGDDGNILGRREVSPSDKSIAALLDTDSIDSREDFIAKAKVAAGEQYAANATPCFGSVVLTGNRYSSLVTCDLSDDSLSVENIEKILDAQNWPHCSKFFHAMDLNDPKLNRVKCFRILEQVSAEPDKYVLEVNLLFYNVRRDDGSLFINYEMDPVQKPSCLVEVDTGYVWVTPQNAAVDGKKANDPTRPGVRIRSSKQERIKGVSTSAMAALACILGWADVGREMFAGTARLAMTNKPAGVVFKPFVPSVDAVEGNA